MHYRSITALAVDAGLVAPKGLTPEASVNTAMTTDIARRRLAGDVQRFIAYGRGLYGLSSQRTVSTLEEAVRDNNRQTRERLHEELREMDPFAFEDLVGRLLTALGFEDVEVTARSHDGGVDVRGTLAVGGITNVKTAIQVKRSAKNVAGRVVRELRGGLSPHERGLIMTTAAFTPEAVTEAQTADRTPISLVDGTKLVELLVDNEIGVERTDVRILRIDTESLRAEPPTPGEPVQSGVVEPTLRQRVTRHASGKNLSLWPLPGGRGAFVQTMTAMLTFVAESEPTLDEFIDWMAATFPTVKKEKSARGYIDVPKLTGLIEPRGDRLVLTADAAAYLASGDAEDLYLTMTRNIAGLSETLDFIRVEPRMLDEVNTYLNDYLGTSWQSTNQAAWRVQWLESFGKASRVGPRWSAV
jgi:hypothetical protein